MTLEGKEMAFTRITWGELEGANSERGETTGFRCLCCVKQSNWLAMTTDRLFRMISDPGQK